MNQASSIPPASCNPAVEKGVSNIRTESARLQPQLGHHPILNFLPDPLMILNRERQILFVNHALNTFLKITKASAIIGLRPGEILHCFHLADHSGVCGTMEPCHLCGGHNAVLQTQKTLIPTMRDCQIRTASNRAYHLRVWTTPFARNNAEYTLVVLRDISNEVYRRMMERIFFHDLLNIGSGLYGLLSMCREDPGIFPENQSLLVAMTEELLEEINSQRELSAAESGSIAVNVERIQSAEAMASVIALLTHFQVAESKHIALAENTRNITFETDPCLLKRVLINMTKNALEAIAPGETVVLKSTATRNKVIFEVHNPGCIPHEVQLQIFNHSFSTKGRGRGIGTYSAKLLGENYLHGKVYFTSSPDDGTSFFVELPLKPSSTTGVTPN